MFHDREIMSNEQVSQAVLPLEILQQIDNLRLHGHIQRADRFVANEQLRFNRQRASNPNALALPATELVRITERV